MCREKSKIFKIKKRKVIYIVFFLKNKINVDCNKMLILMI